MGILALCVFKCMVYVVHTCACVPTPVYTHSESKRRHLVMSSITSCLTSWRKSTSLIPPQVVRLASTLPGSLVSVLQYRDKGEHSYAKLFIWVLALKFRSLCLNSKSSYPLSHFSRPQSFLLMISTTLEVKSNIIF